MSRFVTFLRLPHPCYKAFGTLVGYLPALFGGVYPVHMRGVHESGVGTKRQTLRGRKERATRNEEPP